MKFLLIFLLTLISHSVLALEFKCTSAIHPQQEGDTLNSVVVIKIPNKPDELVEKVIKENVYVKLIFRYGKDYYSLHSVDTDTGNDLGFSMTSHESPNLMLYTPISSIHGNAWANCQKIN